MVVKYMSWFTYCRNKECPKNNKCKRYVAKDPPNENVINFKHICNEENNYYLMLKIDSTDLVVKEEGENN
jgi:hypothetical protein